MSQACYICRGAHKCAHGGLVTIGDKVWWLCNVCLRNMVCP